MLGPDAWEAYRLLPSDPPTQPNALFLSGGYAIQRTGWDPFESHLIFDTGGIGMLTGGHSHADALSIVLSSQGRELLVDPGTCVYNSAPEWRNYFRSTRAHNTVTIDGQDQAEAGGTFRWKTKMSTRMHRDASMPPEYLEAEHDGYNRLPQPVIHRRRLLHIPGEYWIIVDDFRGSGNHTFDFHYHFGSQVDATMECPSDYDLAIRAQEAELFLGIYASHPMTPELLTAQTAPITGWISRGYGHRQPSCSLRATFETSASSSPAAITFLVPHSTSPVIERLTVDAGSAIACAYHHDAFKDIAVFSTGTSEIQVSGLRMQGEFFWIRMKESVVLKTIAIRGRLQQPVLEDAICAQFAAS
jgi:hypothetical protein